MEDKKITESNVDQGLVSGERKFLHDLSNQLVVSQGMSSFVFKAMNNGTEMGEKEKERMGKVISSIKNIVELVQNRREYLHSQSDLK